MRPFDYLTPTTVEEAIALLDGGNGGAQGLGGTQALAGGTDLLTLMKEGIAAPERLISIQRLDDLPRGIEENEEGVTLGALTTLSEIERSELLQARYPALAEAAALAATPQLRNMATIGGNLLQRPRCWYFRSPLFHCWLKGGDKCPARDGQNQLHSIFDVSPCVAVHPSDPAPALLAYGAEVRLRGPQGERTLPLADFYAPPDEERRQETVLGDDELLLSLHLPTQPEGTRSTYLKAMERKVWAFALVSVAAVIQVSEGEIAGARLVLGGVAPIPWRLREAEQALVGERASTELFARVADIALADAEPLAHNAYKVSLAKRLLRRALTELTT